MAFDPKWASRLGLLATAGLVLSLGVHVMTLFGVNAAAWSKLVYVLHIGIFFVFIPFILDVRRFRIGAWRGLITAIPWWAYLAVFSTFAYASVTFRKTLNLAGGGVMQATDIRGVQGFSALWLPFYLIPAVYFCLVLRTLANQGRNAA